MIHIKYHIYDQNNTKQNMKSNRIKHNDETANLKKLLLLKMLFEENIMLDL